MPKGRPRFFVNKNTGRVEVYTPKRTEDYENIVKQYTKNIIKQPIEDYIELSIIVFFEIPKSWPKYKKEDAKSGIIKPGYSDVDNLAKSILDGMNKVAYKDDRQIVKITIEKRYGEKSESIVIIQPLKN